MTTTMNRNSDTMGAVQVTPAMWEQRRYEIAKDVLAESYAAKRYYQGMEVGTMIQEAIDAADALIEELKKQRQ